MKKILIAYDSKTGNTQRMARHIAEGLQAGGNTVILKNILDVREAKDLQGYDAYFFGGPTYFEQPTDEMKAFLFMARQANLVGKIGGSFGSYTHFGNAPKIIHETMEHVFKMDMVYMGPFKVKDLILDSQEGCATCVEYATAISQRM